LRDLRGDPMPALRAALDQSQPYHRRR